MERLYKNNLDLLDNLPEKKMAVLREKRQPYLNAYNIALNNHIAGAKEEDKLTDTEFREMLSWFNELRDVTDTLDMTVFDRIPLKVLKHLRG